MSLSLYQKKRNFSDTPEPAGKERSSAKALRFVVQKHDASHLHYDFRLELNGVLLSWAVPKGPSVNPADKRLAMHVEDHPYDYRNFEGTIPEGNYGAGTVIVWDEGNYAPLEPQGLSRKEMEKELNRQYKAGSMHFVLNGEKLKGAFHLLKLGRDEKSWLLMKSRDEYAAEKDITKKNKSVKSGQTLAQVAKAAGSVLKNPETKTTSAVKPAAKKTAAKKTATKKTAAKKAATKKTAVKASVAKSAAPAKKAAAKKKAPAEVKANIDPRQIAALIKTPGKEKLSKTPFPAGIKPMMATLVEQPFSGDEWIYEIKWDGYRAVAELQKGKCKLISRNGNNFTDRYPQIAEALSELPFEAVFDGEIIAVNEEGMANFQLLQNEQNERAALRYYIFDLLWLDGYDLTGLPLVKRKELLKGILPAGNEFIFYSDHIEKEGAAFFDAAQKKGLEGIMAKRADSRYRPGFRSGDWLKIKVNQRQEVVIGGYTQPRNSRKHFGALLLGAYVDGELHYVGHTGSGFNTEGLEAIYKQLQPLVTERSPFHIPPKGNMPVTWVKPKLVCEIKFTEWTKDWIARHPIFMGMRTDKKPSEVIIEKSKKLMAGETEKKPAVKKAAAKKTAAKQTPVAKKAAVKKAVAKKAAVKKAAPKRSAASKKGQRVSLDNGTGQSLILSGNEVGLTNLDKIYWPKEKIRKIDMINYYLEIAPYIMPYMMNRPQSLHRHPSGINGQSFYQKDMKTKLPDWAHTHSDFSESTNANVNYLVCDSEATLIYMANMGCIELHPWHSRVESWEYPDWCLIDLDPEGIGFDKVIETALVVKDVLDALGIKGYPKTSGSTGIHIYIPLGAQYDYTSSKTLAEWIVTLVHRELPDTTSMERSPAKRRNKIYLDYLQNRQTQTAAAPYSLRPKPGAPVSTPLDWSEVKTGLTPGTWNIHNIFERLKSEGDLFKPVLGKGINLERVLKKK